MTLAHSSTSLFKHTIHLSSFIYTILNIHKAPLVWEVIPNTSIRNCNYLLQKLSQLRLFIEGGPVRTKGRGFKGSCFQVKEGWELCAWEISLAITEGIAWKLCHVNCNRTVETYFRELQEGLASEVASESAPGLELRIDWGISTINILHIFASGFMLSLHFGTGCGLRWVSSHRNVTVAAKFFAKRRRVSGRNKKVPLFKRLSCGLFFTLQAVAAVSQTTPRWGSKTGHSEAAVISTWQPTAQQKDAKIVSKRRMLNAWISHFDVTNCTWHEQWKKTGCLGYRDV